MGLELTMDAVAVCPWCKREIEDGEPVRRYALPLPVGTLVHRACRRPPAPVRVKRGMAVYLVYGGAERACDLCAPNGSHKRALFFDQRRTRYLCAKCMVSKMDANEANA